MNISGRYFLLLAACCLTLFSSMAEALTCKAAGGVSETVAIDSVLKASIGEFGFNKKIWVSSPITATFTCSDTDSHPAGESAYLWLDPKDEVKNVHNSLEIGITYKNIDYKLIKGDKVEIGPGTLCRPNGQNGCLTPAAPQTFTLTYQVYIKTTGFPASSDGKVMGNINLSLFQVDGVGGLRGGSGGNDGNFNLYINGLDKITFLGCTPRVTLVPDTLDFGINNIGRALPGRVEQIKPFSVLVDLTREAGGKSCDGETLLLTLSSNNPVKDGNIIMPAANSGFGFVISENSALQPLIPLNAPQTFGTIGSGGEQLTHNYYAGFIWTSDSPQTGEYSATATLTVTFK